MNKLLHFGEKIKMNKILRIVILLSFAFFNASLFAVETLTSNDLVFDCETQKYTDKYSGTIVTYPENWTLDHFVGSSANKSETVVFVAPEKAIGVGFSVEDMYENTPSYLKLFATRDTYNNDFMINSLLKKETNPSNICKLMLNGKEFIRKYDAKNNLYLIVTTKNGIIYRFFASVHLESENYKIFETIVANAVLSSPKIK